ncbi:hypothetical protein N2W53_000577 [Clostridium perfringens]|uniref:hypothetical protein n=1 Tax=Clostridium perfringens TaxID=1502 RepID=UPI00290818EB|nr:hypothetical protein [Clostridium perfringens]EGT4137967.1 hypothetical protein [Clostridium perfringens]EJT6170028.1 hypothetical protein [Clostridium perfringens]EJT6540750.1 hypothetical protein [Clostridium perfringens]EJT6565757.1 hypothetical protein [Clostridium perfringens]MBS5993688.1 hypothetical protein [Clostridium perfringens]
MKRKLLLGNEELEFKMTNGTYLYLDNEYGSAGRIINSMMYGVKAFDEGEEKPKSFGADGMLNNSLKILSASCITRELEVKELEEKLTPDQLVSEAANLAGEIYFDYRGIKKSEEEEESETSEKK